MTEVITFTGVQGSGKTTMRIMLANHLKLKGKTVINQYDGVMDSISRDAGLKGFTLNEETNFETQYYLANKYIVLDIETRKRANQGNFDYLVLDRSVLDVIPYALNAESINFEDKELIRDMLYEHFRRYPSNLIYCVPLRKIEGDGIRSVNQQFQDEIDNEFVEVMNKVRSMTNVTTLGLADVKTRFKYLLDEIGL